MPKKLIPSYISLCHELTLAKRWMAKNLEAAKLSAWYLAKGTGKHSKEYPPFDLLFTTELVYKIVKIMAYKGWRNLERSKPPINELVELQHMITGIGAPEREGWVSVGRMRENGKFSIKQNASGTVDFRPPTHWKALKE